MKTRSMKPTHSPTLSTDTLTDTLGDTDTEQEEVKARMETLDLRQVLYSVEYEVVDGLLRGKRGRGRGHPPSFRLPVQLPLTRAFGFFIGAFVAEGFASQTGKVTISNNDKDYREASAQWLRSVGVPVHEYPDRIVFSSTLLADILRRLCGFDAYQKSVPPFTKYAPPEFVDGLLDAYLSGDACVSTGYRGVCIRAVSRSLTLLENVRDLLCSLGMEDPWKQTSLYTRMEHRHGKIWVDAQGKMHLKKHGPRAPMYYLRVGAKGTRFLAARMTLTVKYKQQLLDDIFLGFGTWE